MKIFLFAAALTAATGLPGSRLQQAEQVLPLPPEVETSAVVTLVHSHPETGGQEAHSEPPARAVVDKIVQFRGRDLMLCLVRSGSSGMAVLSVPEDSIVPSLPEIPEQEFLDLVTAVSGCQPDGDVREVASSRGAIAVSSGLDCSGS